MILFTNNNDTLFKPIFFLKMSIQFFYRVDKNDPQGDVPPRLRPVQNLRVPVYLALGRNATAMEKNWIIREAMGENLSLVDNVYRPAQKKADLLRKYELTKNFFSSNMTSYIKYSSCLEAHRPNIIKPNEIIKVADSLIDGRAGNHEPTVSEVMEMFERNRNAGIENAANSSEIDDCFSWVSRRTMLATIKKYYLILSVDSTSNTDARLIATMDPIMSYVWYLVNLAFSSMLPSNNKWNCDATTYIMEPFGKGKRVVRLSEKDEHYLRPELNVRYNHQPKRKSASNLSFGIKLVHLSSAYGQIGPMVAILAMDEMPEGAFHVETVSIFTSSNSSTTAGLIYFCRTRAGNAALWKHYMLHVVVPCITSSGDSKNTASSGYFFSSDSEDIIISQVFDPEVHEKFTESNIVYARIGAALTSIHQAADRQRTFLCSKKYVKEINEREFVTKLAHPIDVRGIQVAFANFKLAYPAVSFPSALEEKYMKGLIAIKLSFCEKVTTSIIQEGFRCCGQHVNTTKPGEPSISFELMMKQCKTIIPWDQLLLMKSLGPELSGIVVSKGTVTLDDLTSRNIRILEGVTKDRSLYSRVHHWAEVVTHDNVLLNYYNEVQAKDPEVREQEQALIVLQKDQKRKEKEALQVSKKAIQDATKLLEKEAALKRKASLTPAEQREEREAKRARMEEVKQQKEMEKMAKAK